MQKVRIRRKVPKTDKKVVHVEREEERDSEVEIMVRRRWTKEVTNWASDASTKVILLDEGTENE